MKSFSKYLIPSLITSLLASAFVLVDGMFIGQAIGDVGLSAINVAWPITAFIQSIALAIGLSSGIYISTLNGRGEEDKAKKVKLTTVIIVIASSFIIGGLLLLLANPLLKLFGAEGQCLEYGNRYIKIILYGSLFQMLGSAMSPLLKNSGKVKIAMAASIASLVVNLVLDYLFILKLNYGLEGAAWASVIAIATSGLINLGFYIPEFKGVNFDKITIKNILIGIPAPFILNYSYSIIIIITNALCLHYGGDPAVAAYTLLSYVLYIINSFALGTADAIQPLFSYNYGAGNTKINRGLLKRCFIISISLIALASILIIIFNDGLAYLYNLSDVAKNYYYDGVYFYIIGFIFIAFQKVICSYFYSINEYKKANILIISEPLVITPIVYLVFCLFIKLNGIWIGFMLIQIILLIIGALFLYDSFFKETKYKALLIDIDDTILDFISSEYYALEKAFNEFGIEYNNYSLNIYLKVNTSYWLKFEKKECTYEDIFTNRWIEFFKSIGKEPIKGANDVYFKYLSTSSIILPNALKALKKLSKQYDIYYITNGNNLVQHNRIYNTPIEGYAKKVYISELIGYNKPDKAYFDYVLNDTGLKKEDVIVIGDSLSSDMLGAKNSEMASIWINSKGKTSDWYKNPETKSLYDAIKIIRKLSVKRN